MSDDDDDEVSFKPEDSKCWTCKHGMCLQEKDMQQFYQPGIVPGNAFEGQQDEQGMSEVTIDMTKVRSVCFWRPNSANGSVFSPLVFNQVKVCSRYEKN